MRALATVNGHGTVSVAAYGLPADDGKAVMQSLSAILFEARHQDLLITGIKQTRFILTAKVVATTLCMVAFFNIREVNITK